MSEQALTPLPDSNAVASLAALPRKQDLAEFFQCSTRHIDRQVDAGKMPKPLRIGHVLRWRREDIEQWLADGCPAVAR